MTSNTLTPQEKAVADELALQRVYAMNNDEYLLQVVDAKIQRLEAHVKAYFDQRFAFHNQQP
ncbi:hypothetical protein A9798_10225 [Edwardsiella hoshinae]|uniref:Uncharacterized protein n=1 Tax=Edwardsiella hoshinae TaxID=93378 RepID=A0A376DGE1_9GAMM|nr:hypothetical protein [Edwardsiella hoshinae]AOV97302.1 hypothetical protein A9798_10225 [Edwardsiella hoshinae]QPR26851.1 hypothetical protein I6G97_10245 [Edwardsiella hoshinae]STC89227.1 Uncharacterised protein [Edwardsiella hoshinae]